jgi:glutamine amidotransferase
LADSIIGVIDYRAGNAQSVIYALDRLGVACRKLSAPSELERVERVVLPGVGSAGATIDSLRDEGWIEPLHRAVVLERMPYLGICVGLQILFEHSEEDDARCLGWLRGTVKRFDAATVRVPQIGWNQVEPRSAHPFVKGLRAGGYYYFVNSYHALPADPGQTAATAEYGADFCAAVAHQNVMATQFHVEKSATLGLELLGHFARLSRSELCSPSA